MAADEMPLQEAKLLLNIPQNPHYRPLQTSPVGLRQHLIAGYDKSFVDVGRKIQKLTAKELERGKADLRETLKELDRMGYDVGLFSRRLDALEAGLLLIAQEYNGVGAKIKEAKMKSEEKRAELRELEEEIHRLQQRVEVKKDGIQELEKWTRELEEGLADIDALISKLAKAPLL